MPVVIVESQPWYCPRCDRTYPTLDAVKKHVEGQHPDHDPEWWDTYPEPYGN